MLRRLIWDEFLRLFDLKAERVDAQDGRFLFEAVTCDGNCAAVCKKLENLLKTYFVRRGASSGGGDRLVPLIVVLSGKFCQLPSRNCV